MAQENVHTIDGAKIKALGMGINLTALRGSIPELEAACNRKIEAQEAFKDVITVAAISTGMRGATERQIGMAHTLYEARKFARLILGEKYAEHMEVYQRGIRAMMAVQKCNELAAAIELIKKVGAEDEGIFILSAAVEMVEPTK